MAFKEVVFLMLLVSISKSKGNQDELLCRMANHDEARADFSKCFEEIYPEFVNDFQNCFNRAGASDIGGFAKYMCSATPEMQEAMQDCHPMTSKDADIELRKEFHRKLESRSEEIRICVLSIVMEHFSEMMLDEAANSDSSEEENEIKKRSAPFYMFPFH